MKQGKVIIFAIFLSVVALPCLGAEWRNTTGDFTMAANTTVTGGITGKMIGIRNGHLTINAGVTMQINPNSKFSFESGKSIKVSRGAFILLATTNGIIKKEPIRWACDAGRPGGFTYDGYCWRMICSQTTLGSCANNSCDAVCNNNGSNCILGGWNDYPGCTVCKNFFPGAQCDSVSAQYTYLPYLDRTLGPAPGTCRIRSGTLDQACNNVDNQWTIRSCACDN